VPAPGSFIRLHPCDGVEQTVDYRAPVGDVSLPVHGLGVAIVLLGVGHVLIDRGPLPPKLAEAGILFAFALDFFTHGTYQYKVITI